MADDTNIAMGQSAGDRTSQQPSPLDLLVLPPDEQATWQRKLIRECDPPPCDSLPNSESPQFQFMLKHLMLTTTVIAIAMGITNWVTTKEAAGIFGTILALALIPVIFFGKQRPMLQLIWTALLFCYLSVSLLVLFSYAD